MGTLVPDRAMIRNAGFTRRAARIGDAARPTPVSIRSGQTPAAGSVAAPEYLFQRQVNAAPMIIVHECLEVPVQTSLVEHDPVIQALAADCADDPLDVSTLPRNAALTALV